MGYFGIPFRNGVPIGLGSVASFGAQQFDPSSLFIGGTAGTFYDPSDPTTLFTTSTGTTPCAVPGSGSQVLMGLMLDKSQGAPGALGAELVTNGDFSNGTTGWGTFAGSIAVSGGEATLTANAGAAFPQITQTVSGLTVGRTYLMTGTARRGTTVDNAFISPVSGVSVQTSSTSATALRITFVAAATSVAIGLGIFSASTNGTAVFDNISVREIPGNHAIAFNDTTARPELSARVNLLTYSEQFENSVWDKGTGGSVSTNTVMAPDGTMTADSYTWATTTSSFAFLSQYVSATSNVANTFSIYLKRPTGSGQRVLRLVVSDVTASSASSGNITVTETWQRFDFTRTSASSTGFVGVGLNSAAPGPSNPIAAGDVIEVWGADLRPANIGSAIPSYQRIADQYTYDSNGFPSYLRFDGVDDSMYTPASINFSGTDKMSVFAGVRKLSDAAPGMVAELSTSVSTGAFDMQAPSSTGGDNYRYRAGGTTIVNPGVASGYAAPVSNVLTAQNDIGAPSISLRVNAVQVVSSASSQGTGNFGTYPLFIGSRNNASVRFNGHLYSLIIAGTQLQSGSITATEQYVAGKTGITI